MSRLEDAIRQRMAEKDAKYGNSWKWCDPHFLYNHLMAETQELIKLDEADRRYLDWTKIRSEALDVAALLWMILERENDALPQATKPKLSREEYCSDPF